MSADLIDSQGQGRGKPDSHCGQREKQPCDKRSGIQGGTLIPNRVFIGAVPPGTCEAALKEFFAAHGPVRDVKIIVDKAGVSKGYGFVTFEEAGTAEQIVQRNSKEGMIFNQRRINIGPAIKKPPISTRQSSNGCVAPSSALNHLPLPMLSYLQPSYAQLPQQQQHHLMTPAAGAAFQDLLLGGQLASAQQLLAPWLMPVQQQLQQLQSLPLAQPLQLLPLPAAAAPMPGVSVGCLQAAAYLDACSCPSEAKRRRGFDWPVSDWSQ